MEELTFFEKLVVLYENILDHPLFVLLFFVPIILFFLQKKHGKKVFVAVYFLVIFALLISFGDIIFKLFDNLMDGLFMFLYFPNFITLFLVVVACSLIALISLLSKNISRVNRIINYVSFGIIQSLFALILITVRVNKINIYKDNALYTNKDVLTLMQFLIGTFSIQVLSIIIIRLINKATNVLDNKANISSDVKKQIVNLSKTKIKPINIDNNKVGYINVADKSLTSKPKLKPFKFDINKLESINFNDYFISKPYSTIELSDKDVSYYNEVIPKKIFNKSSVNFNKDFNVNVPDSLYKSFKLSNRDFSYLNEVIRTRKLKPIMLDSNKFVYLKLINKGFKRIILQNKNVFYLNEVIKKRKLKPILLDSRKIVNLNVPSKSYNIFTLNNKMFEYLNEANFSKKYRSVDLDLDKDIKIDVPNKKYSISSIDNDKSVSLDVSNKGFSKVSLKDKAFGYLNEVVKKVKPVKVEDEKNDITNDSSFKFDDNLFKEKGKFDYNESKKSGDTVELESEYDKMFNSKPDLLKPMKNKFISEEKHAAILPVMTFPRQSISPRKIIDNLQIVDIQSTLDVIVKCHLMKKVSLKTYEKMTVSNLEICNFKLVSSIINVYKLYKNNNK